MSDHNPPPPPPPRPERPYGSGFPSGPPTGPPRPPAGRPPAPPAPPSTPPVGGSPWTPPGAGPVPPTAPPTGPYDPYGPQPPDDPGGGRRRGLVIAGILAVMALVIGAVGYWAVAIGDDGETADRQAPTTPEDRPEPDTSSPPDSSTPSSDLPPVDEAELLAVVRELQTYVEEARNLTFSRDVVVELEDDAAFEARLLEDFEEDVEEFEQAEVLYRALGLLDSDQPLADLLRDLYAEGVLGFYDTETDELVVRGSALTPYVKQTIVHELVHALDDQNFELFRPQYDDLLSEVPTGFSAVVEGNARRIENEWLDEQPADVQDQAADEEAAFGAGLDIDAFPYVLIFEIAAPYEFGEVFVDHIVGGQGERAVDQALNSPPETSEQFLFPEVYDALEPRVDVPSPGADGELVDEGTVGALFLFGLLTDPDAGVDPFVASEAVRGWGGDWYVTWTEGEADCVRADLVGDTDPDTAQIGAAIEEWVGNRGVGAVSEVDGRIRFESCAAGGADSDV